MGFRLGAGWVAVGMLAACATSGDGNSSGPSTLGDGDASSTVAVASDGADTIGATSMVDTSVGSVDTTAGDDAMDTGPGDTTGGGAVSCRDDPTACTAWILPVGNSRWSPVALDAESGLAPSDGVQAAFDFEGPNEGFVLTGSQLHVVDLITREWVRATNRSTELPQLGDATITSAYAVPPYWGVGSRDVASVTFLSATDVYIYEYDVPSETFTFIEALADFGPNWATANAPAPSELRAGWLDLVNDRNWFDVDIAMLCGSEAPPGPYTAYVGADAVYLADAGNCFDFATPVPYDAFTPFSYVNAPPIDRVGASFYNELAGFWVFAP